MNEQQRSCMRDLARDRTTGLLWQPISEPLEAALRGGDLRALARAASAAARALSLTHRQRLPDLLDRLQAGLDRMLSYGPAGGKARARLLECRAVLQRAVAEGYAEGKDETIADLRRQVDSLSPADPASGVLRPRQTGDLLSVELLRCQRMDLPLGIAAVAPANGRHADRPAGRRSSRRGDPVGRVLRDGVRRYDVVGSLDNGRHVLLLPGVSREGLLTAVERLHRRLEEDPRTGEDGHRTFVLMHLDCADVSAEEVLTTVADAGRAVSSADYVVWV